MQLGESGKHPLHDCRSIIVVQAPSKIKLAMGWATRTARKSSEETLNTSYSKRVCNTTPLTWQTYTGRTTSGIKPPSEKNKACCVNTKHGRRKLLHEHKHRTCFKTHLRCFKQVMYALLITGVCPACQQHQQECEKQPEL
jgi:hypothetical protein